MLRPRASSIPRSRNHCRRGSSRSRRCYRYRRRCTSTRRPSGSPHRRSTHRRCSCTSQLDRSQRTARPCLWYSRRRCCTPAARDPVLRLGTSWACPASARSAGTPQPSVGAWREPGAAHRSVRDCPPIPARKPPRHSSQRFRWSRLRRSSRRLRSPRPRRACPCCRLPHPNRSREGRAVRGRMRAQPANRPATWQPVGAREDLTQSSRHPGRRATARPRPR
jgi:hypothetical protein